MGLNALGQTHDGPHHTGGGVVHAVVRAVQRSRGGRLQLLNIIEFIFMAF